MSLDALAQYLQEIESAIGKLDKAYVERYEEEHLPSERLNLRIWSLLRRQDNQGWMVEVHSGLPETGICELNATCFLRDFQYG